MMLAVAAVMDIFCVCCEHCNYCDDSVATDMCRCLDSNEHWSRWHRTCAAFCSHLRTAAVSSVPRRSAVDDFSGMTSICWCFEQFFAGW